MTAVMMLIVVVGCVVALAAVGWFVLTWFGRGLDAMSEDGDGEWLS